MKIFWATWYSGLGFKKRSLSIWCRCRPQQYFIQSWPSEPTKNAAGMLITQRDRPMPNATPGMKTREPRLWCISLAGRFCASGVDAFIELEYVESGNYWRLCPGANWFSADGLRKWQIHSRMMHSSNRSGMSTRTNCLRHTKLRTIRFQLKFIGKKDVSLNKIGCFPQLPALPDEQN